jgi:hypothetical protein
VIDVAGVTAAAAPVVLRASSDVSTWEKVAASFTAVGGLGAMVGAIAAWRAAISSGQAARDARDALAASVKPHVHLDFTQQRGTGGPVEARAMVVAPLSSAGVAGVAPATDVQVEFTLASGGHGSSTHAVLEPAGSIRSMDQPYAAVVVGHPDENWPPDGGDRITATVTYSDVRGVGRYRLTRSCDLWPSNEVGVVSFRDPSEPAETRIRP